MTLLAALCTIAIDQTKATEKTLARCTQLLDYLASTQEAKVRFHASDMIMNRDGPSNAVTGRSCIL